jgi:hypothetical protein
VQEALTPRVEHLSSLQCPCAPGYLVLFQHWSLVLLGSVSSSVYFLKIPCARVDGRPSSSTNFVDSGLHSTGAFLVSGAGRSSHSSLDGLRAAVACRFPTCPSPASAKRLSASQRAAAWRPAWIGLSAGAVGHIVTAVLHRVIAVALYWAKQEEFRWSVTVLARRGRGAHVRALGCVPDTCNHPSQPAQFNLPVGGWPPWGGSFSDARPVEDQSSSWEVTAAANQRPPAAQRNLIVTSFSYAGVSFRLRSTASAFGAAQGSRSMLSAVAGSTG